MFRHWTLRTPCPPDKTLILIDLEAANENETDLSAVFDIKKEIAIEDEEHFSHEIMDPYYYLENALDMGDEDVKDDDEGKGGSEGVGKAAEPSVGEATELSVVEATEPSVVEATEPSVGEATEPSVGEPAEPSMGEAAEPPSALGDSKPHDHQEPPEGSRACMTPAASITKVPFTPTPHDALSNSDLEKRIASLK